MGSPALARAPVGGPVGAPPQPEWEPGPGAREPRGPRLGYLPELDGIRGAGLLAVLAYHHGLAVARGGPLAVSMFFTLSGFLIARLALAEWSERGSVSLGAFWERRARRLLPAALFTLAGTAVLQAALGIGSGAGPGFRIDLLAALGYATNWRLVAEGGDYAALFSEPSPLTHFWSLAIEEQFYLAFPLAFVGLMRLRAVRLRPHRAGLAFAAVAAASFVVAARTAAGAGNGGLAYYGTHTRAGEILAGVAVACALAHPGVAARLRGRTATAAVRGAAAVGLMVMAWLWHTTSLGDPHLFRGITALNALCTVAVVVAATTGGGPVRRLLAVAPLAALGKISYAAYLFHWPLYLALDESRVPVGYRGLFAVRVGATLAAAALSYWLLERPVRRRLVVPTRPRLGLTLAAGGLAVVVLAATVPVPASSALDLTADPGAGDRVPVRQHDVVDFAPEGVAAEVLVAGDSVSWSLLLGLGVWNHEHPDQQLRADTHIAFGCPLSGPGEWRGPRGVMGTFATCDTWLPDLPAAIARSAPDAVVMVMGLADVGGREVAGRWREPGDPVFDRWFARRVDRVADALERGGAPVVWLTYPYVLMADPHDPTRDPATLPLNDPARIDALNAEVRRAAAGRPGFTVVDLNRWVASWPDPFDRELRDGVHFTMGGSARVAQWLAPQLVAQVGSGGGGGADGADRVQGREGPPGSSSSSSSSSSASASASASVGSSSASARPARPAGSAGSSPAS